MKKWPDMPLAAFSLGQILLSRQDHTKALALFEGVHAKYPEDRDSQAFIILLNSITKSELYPFDKLREVVTGFVFEADVWQIQGYLRHSRSQDASKGEDITLALRCYEMSMAAMRKQNSAVPSRFLSNLGVLYHSTGSLDTALVYIRDAILTAPSFDMTDILVSSKVFCHDELFFLNAHCSEEDQMMFRVNHDCTLSPVHNENGENLQTCPDLSTRYSLGDILICDDLVSSFVTAVSPGSISVRTQDGYAKLEAKGSTIKTRHVTCGGLVTDRTLTFCFNYARVLEDMMAFNAAAELYKELLTMHPAYWECKHQMIHWSCRSEKNKYSYIGKLRLGCIAKSKGQFQEALTLFAQALEFVGSETAGVVHCYMGEIQRSLRQHELAKKAFEKVVERFYCHFIINCNLLF